MSTRRRRFVLVMWFAIGLMFGAAHAQQPMALVPPSFTLNDAAAGALAAPWMNDSERSVMRVRHGVWDDRDLTSPTLRAIVALNAWNFDHASLSDPSVPAELRAEAKFLAGEFEQAIEIVQPARSLRAARIRAASQEGLGRFAAADEVVSEAVKRLLQSRITDPDELTEGVRTMLIRARLQGQPARDFQSMIDLLGRAYQELDRLHWGSRVAQSELFWDKDNTQDAVIVLHEALGLNPRCAEGWYRLGQIALSRFDFSGAANAAAALRRLNRQHPLADLLQVEQRLTQDDPDGALEILNPLLKRWPKMRPARALYAAAAALTYNEASLQQALDEYDALSPGSATAYFEAGRYLALNRQYGLAASVLEEAARRAPAWPAPQIELGLMELQSGRDDRALQVLQQVLKLDPFNRRATFSHFLLEELVKYTEIESEHFIVRYKPGVDQVVADMMLPELERIHATVAGRFQFEPPQKTLIELHPNHERFAVRITGMPSVHTIAACTGPVIALEVPREGPPSKHLGLFDWPRVIQHEYAHTITLAQTRNRIPHWLTEAAAVSMEPGPRTYETCLQLAHAYRTSSLFNLDEIKWAFVRPKKPSDRGLAYAQGFWMVQYMNERFGESALVRLLDHYYHGEREQTAIQNALGISREQFYKDFLAWAGAQVKSWGLGATPTLEELSDELRNADESLSLVMAASRQARVDVIVKRLTDDIGKPSAGGDGTSGALKADAWPPLVRPSVEISDEQLAKWIDEHPDHPDLLELQLRRRVERLGDALDSNDQALIFLLDQYAFLRPVDPYPHKKLAQVWLGSATPVKAIPHLEFLDEREEKSPVYAVQLAKLYRQSGAIEKALAKATRALHINPYSAPNRELAASIALEAKRPDAARMHVVALTLLEPDRPQHAKRLEAIDKFIATQN